MLVHVPGAPHGMAIREITNTLFPDKRTGAVPRYGTGGAFTYSEFNNTRIYNTVRYFIQVRNTCLVQYVYTMDMNVLHIGSILRNDKHLVAPLQDAECAFFSSPCVRPKDDDDKPFIKTKKHSSRIAISNSKNSLRKDD
jgi:hypothetical protein